MTLPPLPASPCSTSPACAPAPPACASSRIGAPMSSRSRRRTSRHRQGHGRRAARAGLPACPSQQARHHHQPEEAGGLALFRTLVAKADVVVENYRPDVKDRLGIDYASLAAINPRIVLGSHQRLRPDRALCEAAGLRPDRPGHGRADVGHRPAGPGAGARRHPRRRPHRRALHRARHHGGAAGARDDGQGPLGPYQPAGSHGGDDGLPGDPLDHEARGAAAGRQRPPDHGADRPLPHPGRHDQPGRRRRRDVAPHRRDARPGRRKPRTPPSPPTSPAPPIAARPMRCCRSRCWRIPRRTGSPG